MHPGWYPDPWHQGALRWWDGWQWTPHLSPYPMYRQYRPDLAGEEIRRERRMFSLAVATVATVGVLWAVQDLLEATVIGDHLRNALNQGTPLGFPGSGFTTWPYWDGWLLLVVTFPFMLWQGRAAIAADKVGYPARRQPNWAFWGFIVPVVNLWFPYLSAVDCFAPGDPRRRLAGHWWGWFLAQQIAPGIVGLVALAGRGPALILAVLALICPALATYFGLKMVHAINAAHSELVGG